MTYISVKEAAILANKNERTIRRWIKSGKVEYTEIRGKYHLLKESFIKKIKIVSGKKIDTISKSIEKKRTKNVSGFLPNISKKNVQTFLPERQTNEILLEEEKEYILDGKMSENKKNNMSVKKIVINPFTSNTSENSVVEMSDNTKKTMSIFLKDRHKQYFTDDNHNNMSNISNTLSTVSDTTVDKYIDSSDNIISFDNKLIGQNKKYFGHNNRTIEMSGYAVRLIEEKEKIIDRYEKENDWLKNEINGLKNDLEKFRLDFASEKENRSKISDFLIDSNRFWQEILAKKNISTYDKKDNDTPDKQKNNFFWLGWYMIIIGLLIIFCLVFIQNIIISFLLN